MLVLPIYIHLMPEDLNHLSMNFTLPLHWLGAKACNLIDTMLYES